MEDTFEGLYTGNPSDRAFGKVIELYNNETTRWGCICAGVECIQCPGSQCPGSCEKCIYAIGEPGDYKNREKFISYAKSRGYVENEHGELVKGNKRNKEVFNTLEGRIGDKYFDITVDRFNNRPSEGCCYLHSPRSGVCTDVSCVDCIYCDNCGDPEEKRAAFVAYAKTKGYVEGENGRLVKATEKKEDPFIASCDCPACLNTDCVEYRLDDRGFTVAVCTICGRNTEAFYTEKEAADSMKNGDSYCRYRGSDSILVRIKDLQRLFRMRKDFKPEDLKLMDLRYRKED